MAFETVQERTASVKSLAVTDIAVAEGISGWEMRYLQISSGSPRAQVDYLEFDGVQLLREQFPEVALNQCGHGGRGAVLLGIPVALHGDALFDGTPWRQGICLARSEHEFNAVVPPGEMISLSVPRAELLRYFAAAEQVDLEHWLRNGSTVVTDPDLARALATRLRDIADTATRGQLAVDHAAIRRALVDEVLQLLGLVVASTVELRQPRFRDLSHATVVQRARAHAQARIGEPLRIEDLCQAARVSRRTLQTSFQEILGLRPVAWLHLLRLDGARRDLLHPGDQLRVSDVLARWGFWHMSRFSAEYRALYGELPSETLRRVRSAA